MVSLNGNKYACETCIKGHRSSNCRHTDRPLFEIKKKGRPVTQCDHCRELRKTKQIHIKCMCEVKEDPASIQSGTKKGHTNIPDCATFPNGLPQALEASVAESKSDHGGLRTRKCKEKNTGHCCMPKKTSSGYRKQDAVAALVSQDAGIPSPNDTAPSTLARLAELRPVQPRPSHHDRSNGRSAPPSSSSSANGLSSCCSRKNDYFSPYGRAYTANHEQFETIKKQLPNLTDTEINRIGSSHSQNRRAINNPSTDSQFSTDEIFTEQLSVLKAASSAGTSWMSLPGMEDVLPSFPSTCGCGDNCRCPGCVEHNPDATHATSAFMSCTNPASCSTYLDIRMISLPDDTSLSIYEAPQTESDSSLEDWIRGVSSLSPEPPSTTTSAGLGQQPSWEEYIPPIMEQLPPDDGFGYTVKSCCGVLCKCDPETCECEIDDENGFDCRREMLFPAFEESSQNSQHQSRHGSPHSADTDFDIKMVETYVRGRSHSSAGSSVDLNSNTFFDGVDIEQAREFFVTGHAVSEPPRSRSSSRSTSSSHSHSKHGLPPPHLLQHATQRCGPGPLSMQLNRQYSYVPQ